MSVVNDIVPSYLDAATAEEKKLFFKTLAHLSAVDGHVDGCETDFIKEAAASHGIEDTDALFEPVPEEELLKDLKKIKNRHLALELVKEMCTLSHVDNCLSDEETLFIGKAGIAMGVEPEKIEQISNWIIDRVIWLEEAKWIFEED